jgi:hypothetical protein
MSIKKIIIIIISFYTTNYLLIDKQHYDVNYFNIDYFREERYRCIRYIDNNYINIQNENTIVQPVFIRQTLESLKETVHYIRDYPYAKCIKYKDDYIEYVINKNIIIIYNTLIIFLLYINIFFL